MQNLEQVRARNALKFANEHGEKIRGPQGGDVIKKLPSLILNHGLLATAAYSFTEKEKEKEGWQKVFDAIAQHLADRAVNVLPDTVKDRASLMAHLTQESTTSETLQQATSETMAWLTYATRFVKKDPKA